MIFFFLSKGKTLIPANTKKWEEWLLKNQGQLFGDFRKEKGVRTPTQNNSLHLGFDLIAKSLNDAGLDIRKVLKPEVEIPWTTTSVKEYLWKPIQKIMTGKESTTELDKTNDINEIWKVLLKHLGQNHHIEYIPFPSKEKEEFDTAGLYKGLKVPEGKPNFDIK